MASTSRVDSGTTAPPDSTPDTVLGTALRVNWEQYNYPPGLNIIHYHLEDVEDLGGRSAVFWAHVNLNALCAGLVLNLVGTITLAGFSVPGKGLQVLYSFFNAILASSLGLYAFYNCYKGTATQNSRLCRRFYMSYTVIMLFMTASAVLAFSSFNGWMGIKSALDETGALRDFWLAWVSIEASLWTANVVTGVVILLKLRGRTGHRSIGKFLEMQEMKLRGIRA